MNVLVVAEYYPRAHDPVRGIWAHRQALAAQDAGARVRVLVLHRPLPPLASVRALDLNAALSAASQPRRAELDGLPIDYVRYLSPPRHWSYASWGAWAAPLLAARLRSIRRSFPFELVHAHYAVPAGDAVRRAAPATPLVVSVHGHDVYGKLAATTGVRRTLAHARVALANSSGTARRSLEHGAGRTRVVHLGADVPAGVRVPPPTPTLVTVANLVPRKRHADVLRALALLRGRHPSLRYAIVGEGAGREHLRELAKSLNVEGQVDFRGAMPHEQAVAAAQAASLFVLPSVDEAFGVSYVEAMAAGVPAVGCRDEDGPEEIVAAGGGIVLVPPRNPQALAAEIDRLLSDQHALAALGQQARATVEREFTWQRCGRETVAAYQEALNRH